MGNIYIHSSSDGVKKKKKKEREYMERKLLPWASKRWELLKATTQLKYCNSQANPPADTGC